jgi:multidrug resistance efflux pump
MGVAIINSYLVLLFLLVHFRIVRFNLFWKLSPFLVLLLTLFGLLIPMNWGAPQGSAIVVRNAVAIVPDVAGEVTEVPVVANTPLKAGEMLFRIDSTPYDAQVKAIEAQLKLSTTRLAQMTRLFERDSGRGFDVEQRQSEVDQLKAQLEGAQWNLDKTVVKAPADGYVTNLALRKGARVANLPLAPVMAFIDTSSTLIGVEINQIDARYIEPGQEVEITFKFAPGQIYSGKVESVLQAVATGQTQTSGTAVAPKAVRPFPLSSAWRWTTIPSRSACRPVAPGPRRFTRAISNRPIWSAACCCGRSRSSITSIRSEENRCYDGSSNAGIDRWR